MSESLLFLGLGLALGLLLGRIRKAAPALSTKLAKPKESDELDEVEILRARYRILTENLAAAVVIRNRQGNVIYCSPFTEVLTGYSLNEMRSSAKDFFLGIVHDDDRENYQRAVKVSSMGEAFQFRYRLYHKQGIEMWVETRTVPIVDDEGDPDPKDQNDKTPSECSTLSVSLDVTHAVRSQRQVEEKNRELQEFSYMISHDLKAPIATIRGMLGIINEDCGSNLDSKVAEPLGHIALATDRLGQLVESVLEYSRVTAGESRNEEVDLNLVLKDVLHDYSTKITEVSAIINVGRLPIVFGDRLKSYQIFSNLVGNALKYRDPSRPIQIDVRNESAKSPRLAMISVRDNGLGIPSGKLSHIFRPFQRAHGPEIEGSGIGLACVKKLVEKAGGEVHVDSEEGKGSVFYVTMRAKA